MKRTVVAVTALLVYCQAAASAEIDTQQRARLSYRGELERSLLSRGVDASISVEGKTLVFWMYMSRATVFFMIKDSEVLIRSKIYGFTKVEFFDKGSSGRWTFDISKGIPNCDTRRSICL